MLDGHRTVQYRSDLGHPGRPIGDAVVKANRDCMHSRVDGLRDSCMTTVGGETEFSKAARSIYRRVSLTEVHVVVLDLGRPIVEQTELNASADNIAPAVALDAAVE